MDPYPGEIDPMAGGQPGPMGKVGATMPRPSVGPGVPSAAAAPRPNGRPVIRQRKLVPRRHAMVHLPERSSMPGFHGSGLMTTRPAKAQRKRRASRVSRGIRSTRAWAPIRTSARIIRIHQHHQGSPPCLPQRSELRIHQPQRPHHPGTTDLSVLAHPPCRTSHSALAGLEADLIARKAPVRNLARPSWTGRTHGRRCCVLPEPRAFAASPSIRPWPAKP